MFVDANRALARSLGCLTLMAVATGCDRVEIKPGKPKNPVASQAVRGEVQAPELANMPVRGWGIEQSLPWDAWYVQYMGGKRIGYFHVSVDKRRLIQIRQTAVYELNVRNEKLQFKVELESLEHPNGTLANFSQSTQVANSTKVIQGELLDNKLTITTKTEAKTARTVVVWQPGTWGVLGVQAILMQEPMQAGEKRKCTVFEPNLQQIVPVELTAGGWEITSLPGDGAGGGTTAELLPVEVVLVSGETSSRSRNWVDASGAILKTVTLDGTMINSFRAPKGIGMRVADEYRLGTLLEHSAKFIGKLPSAKATSATYTAEGSRVDVNTIWAKNVRQTVKSLDALTAEITVQGGTGNNTGPDTPPDLPTDSHSVASRLIQSDHPAVKLLAEELVGDASGSQEIALALTKGVAKTLESKDFSATVDSALLTARRREGDCTEHAMLLVALLRSRNIPARIASGLRIASDASALKYDMWAEAWIDDHWLSLDGQSGAVAGVDRLKMFDSAMDGGNPYSAILPIIDKMSFITIKRNDR